MTSISESREDAYGKHRRHRRGQEAHRLTTAGPSLVKPSVVIARECHEAAPFAALVDVDGYLPLEDHGLIGDGETAALVGRDGAISWLCLPRFDSLPLFSSILDHRRGCPLRSSRRTA